MMKRLVVFALAAIAFVAMPQSLKAAEGLCPRGNATLSGTYMLRGEGTIVGGGPVTVVGWLTYDGKGNVVAASMTASVNGTIFTGPISGPYTVNSDCSGSLQAGGHYNFVVTPDGKEVYWIQTDPGTVTSGTILRLGDSE
jgi:hypothetical protein